MRCGIPGILTVTAAAAWATLSWLAGREGNEISPREVIPAKQAVARHFVTPGQLVECGASADRRLESFSAAAHDGTRFAWPAAGGARPLVLVFIKRDCRCSVEFEPYALRDQTRRKHLVKLVATFDWRAFGLREHREVSA